MKEISVVGHKNPDTDATLSAIIATDFLTKKGYKATPYLLGELNSETKYLLEKYSISQPVINNTLPEGIDVCLVDHNEASQSPDNIADLNVTHIIDHHKICFESSEALFIRVEPICSTASILYKMYQEADFEISKEIATMMLACIMSDSMLWKSPTSTDEDQVIAGKLQKIAGIESLENFAMPMFHAKSDLGDISALELIQVDYKIFEVNGNRLGVGTLETTSPDYALGRKNEILDAFEELKTKQNLNFAMLCVVDILNETNTAIVPNGDEIQTVETIFSTSVKNNLADLGRRLSRKKQIAPDLTDYFS